LQSVFGWDIGPWPAYALVLLARINLRQFREDTAKTLTRVLALELG